MENSWATRRSCGDAAACPGAVPVPQPALLRAAIAGQAAVGVGNCILQEQSTALSGTQGSGFLARAGSLEHPKVSLREQAALLPALGRDQGCTPHPGG